MYEGNVSHRVTPVGLGQRHSKDASDTSMATTLSPCMATQHWSQPHLCQAGQFDLMQGAEQGAALQGQCGSADSSAALQHTQGTA